MNEKKIKIKKVRRVSFYEIITTENEKFVEI